MPRSKATLWTDGFAYGVRRRAHARKYPPQGLTTAHHLPLRLGSVRLGSPARTASLTHLFFRKNPSNAETTSAAAPRQDAGCANGCSQNVNETSSLKPISSTRSTPQYGGGVSRPSVRAPRVPSSQVPTWEVPSTQDLARASWGPLRVGPSTAKRLTCPGVERGAGAKTARRARPPVVVLRAKGGGYTLRARCRLHGGLSTGPRTTEGLQKCVKAGRRGGAERWRRQRQVERGRSSAR